MKIKEKFLNTLFYMFTIFFFLLNSFIFTVECPPEEKIKKLPHISHKALSTYLLTSQNWQTSLEILDSDLPEASQRLHFHLLPSALRLLIDVQSSHDLLEKINISTFTISSTNVYNSQLRSFFYSQFSTPSERTERKINQFLTNYGFRGYTPSTLHLLDEHLTDLLNYIIFFDEFTQVHARVSFQDPQLTNPHLEEIDIFQLSNNVSPKAQAQWQSFLLFLERNKNSTHLHLLPFLIRLLSLMPNSIDLWNNLADRAYPSSEPMEIDYNPIFKKEKNGKYSIHLKRIYRNLKQQNLDIFPKQAKKDSFKNAFNQLLLDYGISINEYQILLNRFGFVKEKLDLTKLEKDLETLLNALAFIL